LPGGGDGGEVYKGRAELVLVLLSDLYFEDKEISVYNSMSKLWMVDSVFIFSFSVLLFSIFFSFLFLFLEQLRLGLISHAVTSVTN